MNTKPFRATAPHHEAIGALRLARLYREAKSARVVITPWVAFLAAAAIACDSKATRQDQAPIAVESAANADSASAPAIVFLGDSLTAGFGLSANEALPARIQARVESAKLEHRVINAGRSGDTTAGGLSRIDWYFRDAINLHAIVIGLGSNDAMRGLPLETIEENLRQMVRRTHERKPNAKVFLWALKTFPNLGRDYADAYAKIFPRVAAEENAILIPFPLEDIAAKPALNQSDGVHPTAEGTELMATKIWETLSARL